MELLRVVGPVLRIPPPPFQVSCPPFERLFETKDQLSVAVPSFLMPPPEPPATQRPRCRVPVVRRQRFRHRPDAHGRRRSHHVALTTNDRGTTVQKPEYARCAHLQVIAPCHPSGASDENVAVSVANDFRERSSSATASARARKSLRKETT
jgi:hypothetical protein